MRRKAAVLALILAVPILASAQPYTLLIESDTDRPGGEEVVQATYDSLADFMSDNPATEDFTDLDLPADWSVVGFAFDGGWYRLLRQDINAIQDNPLNHCTYESLADVISDTFIVCATPDYEVERGFNVVGFAADGQQYHLLLERISDAPGGDEVFVYTYDSILDFLTHNSSGGGYSDLNIGPGFSVRGFASDGEQYHLIIESDIDAPFGQEVTRATFDSFVNFLDGLPSGVGWTDHGLGPPWSIGGFAGVIGLFADGFESGNTSAWSSTVP